MDIYKRAENQIRAWLDKPDLGYCFDRIPDQTSGFFGSKNICDFTLFKSPYFYYIESKATYADRFDFSLITEYQHENLLTKSKLPYVFGLVIVLFISYKRAFILNIQDIHDLELSGKKSLNILKIHKWTIPYAEIPTLPSRKELLDYTGDIESLVQSLKRGGEKL